MGVFCPPPPPGKIGLREDSQIDFATGNVLCTVGGGGVTQERF